MGDRAVVKSLSQCMGAISWGKPTLFRYRFNLANVYERWSKPVNPEAGADIVEYDDKKITRNIKYVVTVLGSLLPIVCIVVLYVVKNVSWRIGIMAMFTALFSAVLVVFTSASESEIFASTAV